MRNVGHAPHVWVSRPLLVLLFVHVPVQSTAPTYLIGFLSLCGWWETGVKEFRASFGFAPGRSLIEAVIALGWIWHVCVCYVQISLSLLVTEDFCSPVDAKLLAGLLDYMHLVALCATLGLLWPMNEFRKKPFQAHDHISPPSGHWSCLNPPGSVAETEVSLLHFNFSPKIYAPKIHAN